MVTKRGKKTSLITQYNTKDTHSLPREGTPSTVMKAIQQDMSNYTAAKTPPEENASAKCSYTMQVNLPENCFLTMPPNTSHQSSCGHELKIPERLGITYQM